MSSQTLAPARAHAASFYLPDVPEVPDIDLMSADIPDFGPGYELRMGREAPVVPDELDLPDLSGLSLREQEVARLDLELDEDEDAINEARERYGLTPISGARKRGMGRRALLGGAFALAATAATAGVLASTGNEAAVAGSALNTRNYQILKKCQRLEGVKYRYGGTSPSTGFDCSGFTQYVYKKVGVTIPRTSRSQASSATRLSSSSLKTGDLVFFYSGSTVYHAAVYAGKNRVWHSPGSGKTVCMAQIWTSSRFFGRHL